MSSRMCGSRTREERTLTSMYVMKLTRYSTFLPASRKRVLPQRIPKRECPLLRRRVHGESARKQDGERVLLGRKRDTMVTRWGEPFFSVLGVNSRIKNPRRRRLIGGALKAPPMSRAPLIATSNRCLARPTSVPLDALRRRALATSRTRTPSLPLFATHPRTHRYVKSPASRQESLSPSL